MTKKLTIKQVSSEFGVSSSTLRRWEKQGNFSFDRTQGGHRRFSLPSHEPVPPGPPPRSVALYSRVSSHDQKSKGDLDRQTSRLLQYCKEKNYTVAYSFQETASGMNDSRPKLKQLLKLATLGKFNILIIEHKDRLTRFNFEIFRFLLTSLGVDLIYLEETLPKTFHSELVEDLLSIMTSFSSKIYGKRSHQNKSKLPTV